LNQQEAAQIWELKENKPVALSDRRLDAETDNGSGETMSKTKRSRIGLTPAEIKGFQTLLLRKREEIVDNVLSLEDEALRREDTNLSNCPMHMGDMGSDTFEIENVLSLADSERRLLREIDEALERIEDGTYGICLGTGQAIGQPRLRAIPWAKYSVEFASLLEKGFVSLGDSSETPAYSQVTAA